MKWLRKTLRIIPQHSRKLAFLLGVLVTVLILYDRIRGAEVSLQPDDTLVLYTIPEAGMVSVDTYLGYINTGAAGFNAVIEREWLILRSEHHVYHLESYGIDHDLDPLTDPATWAPLVVPAPGTETRRVRFSIPHEVRRQHTYNPNATIIDLLPSFSADTLDGPATVTIEYHAIVRGDRNIHASHTYEIHAASRVTHENSQVASYNLVYLELL